MLKVGLTGGIGAGKSWVAKVFSLLNVPIYNADFEAKKLINTNPELKNQITAIFGKNAYDSHGNYNRSFISSQVFKNKDLLSQLNEAVHPKVKTHLLNWFSNLDPKHNYAIEEAALIDEKSGLDILIVVQSPIELRIERILKRDSNRSKQEILSIIEKQRSEGEFEKIADYLIYNDEKQMIIPQVLALNEKLK